jgi:hypothetical protein
MSEKYHINVNAVPPHFKAVGKGTVLDWGEGCLRCTRCVKETCPYHAFRDRTLTAAGMTDTIDSLCKTASVCPGLPGNWSARRSTRNISSG